MAVHHSKHMLHLLLIAILIASTKTQPTPKQKCPPTTKCGNVIIPFPFGTTEACSLDSPFLITCDKTVSPHTPFLMNKNNQNIRVRGISLDGKLNISLPVASVCVNNNTDTSEKSNISYIDLTPFHLSSTQTKLTVVGADTGGALYCEPNQSHPSACVSSYNYDERPTSSSSCSGVYCCQTEILQKLSNFSYFSVANVFNANGNFSDQFVNYPCGYTFLVEKDSFEFSKFITKQNKIKISSNSNFPVTVDWAVGNHTCQHAKNNGGSSYACKSNYSECYNAEGGYGYLCNCSTGFRGNPYLPYGCQDVDECSEKSHDCCEEATCRNTDGGYECDCRNGHRDGKKKGRGCCNGQGDGKTDETRYRRDRDLIIVITLSMSASILILLGAFFVYCTLKKRKFIKLKAQLFQQNGGLFLQQQIAKYKGSTKMTKVFTIKELKEASNDFDEGMVLGEGGQGKVYKGIFARNKIVAIKKSKISNSKQVEQFINEVIMLSQINHRNVVKLIGCCLETEVPLLVYEFIPNGSVYERLHNQRQSLRFTWKTRLRIATETAQALAYLHSATSTPIIHRDVKTANILLDHNLVAKVADFGASRNIPLDQTQVTTLVQGTLGYLDPEYFRTSQLTEKSDVYSFGVVLIELLTGEKVLCFDRPEDDINLAMLFDSSIKEGKLVNIVDKDIIDEANIEQLMEVANIARHCLRLKGEERPTMREVAMELEGICGVEKHRWENTNLCSAESENFLNETQYALDIVDEDGGRGNISSGFDISNHISTSLNNGR